MIITKAQLAVADIADKEPGICNVVKIESNGSMVATNGSILAVVKPDPSFAESDFPSLPGVPDPTDKPELLAGCCIPADSLKTLAKSFPKAKGSLPILQTARVLETLSNENGSIFAVTSDLETGQQHQLRKSEVSFPQYEKVIPEGKPEFKIALDWHLLAKLGKVADSISGRGPRDQGILILEFYGPERAFKLTLGGKEAGNDLFLGVMMPCQLPKGLD